MEEETESREKRRRRTGRRGRRLRIVRASALVILISTISVLLWNYDYRGGISLHEGMGIALVILMTIVYFATGIRREPPRGWEKIELERREVQKARRRRSQNPQ